MAWAESGGGLERALRRWAAHAYRLQVNRPREATMTELQRYLAEEVAEDHADGIITRREAMRRLGLLGLSGGASRA